MIERVPYVKMWGELSQEKSMLFMAGPRQCGKTTLAKHIASGFANKIYFNWDIPGSKAELVKNPFFFENVVRRDNTTPLIVFDELHKYKNWKNYLKGIYDRCADAYRFLVSGSGRLDLYQKGGDSLAGRYYLFHLWPLTLSELAGRQRDFEGFLDAPLTVCTEDTEALTTTWERLRAFSGFPEPYVAAKRTTYRRWSNTYHRQLICEDIRNMAGIRNVDDVEILFSLLPSKVGSPCSLTNLAGDLRVAYNTVKSWLHLFERFYLTFSLTPWVGNIARAIHKERKVYLFDYGSIEDPAARFENMVALELFRAVSAWTDMGYGQFNLHYIRTKEKREIDFVVIGDGRPILLIETKLSDASFSPELIKFQQALNVPAVQLLADTEGYRLKGNSRLGCLATNAATWLCQLP